MQDFTEYLEVDFIIWNSNLGVCDFVTIGRIDDEFKNGWLEEPYEMVGPFSLDELKNTGQISFAACVVMSEEKWEKEQSLLLKESFEKQRKSQEQLYEDIKRYNKQKRESKTNLEQVKEREHRELLYLPLEGVLKVSQIKSAYRLIAKIAHPDVGGNHERFIKITQARDALLEK
jgi:hypothetical protein